jgi:hypothetical protein
MKFSFFEHKTTRQPMIMVLIILLKWKILQESILPHNVGIGDETMRCAFHSIFLSSIPFLRDKRYVHVDIETMRCNDTNYVHILFSTSINPRQ